MAIKSPEANPNTGEDGENAENLEELSFPENSNPFDKLESEAIQSQIAKYAEGTEISDGSRKVVDGFLARDAEEGYSTFALAWFEDHKDQIQKEKGVPVENVSDEWKINMVLGSKEKGGLGVSAEIKEGKYKWIGDEIGKIGVLRTDMAKKPVPPETPFLLLNYLQKSVEGERKKIEVLKIKAEKGDEPAGVEAASMEKQLESLFQAQKEIIERTMREDLTQEAEQRVQSEPGFETKEQSVENGIDAKKKEVENQENEELIDTQRLGYVMLPEKDRREYQSRLGFALEMPRDEFDKLTAGRKYTPEQADAAFQKTNREMFKSGLLQASRERGIEGPAFYGLLKEGYKPHEAYSTLQLWPPSKIFTGRMSETRIPKSGGKSFNNDGGKENFETFIKRAGDNYTRGIEILAQGQLEDEWDKDHDQKLKAEMVKRMEELAKSPENADRGVEGVYEKARERIMVEYIKDRATKHPKTAEQIKVLQKELNESKKKININDVFADLLSKKGGLEDLDEDNEEWKVPMSNYLHKSLGIESVPAEAYNKITKEDYKKYMKKPMGLFHLFMKVMQNHSEILAKGGKIAKKIRSRKKS